jgi:uncharacterized protein (TIGR02147 family)
LTTKDGLGDIDIFTFTNYRSYLRTLATVWTDQGKTMSALAEFCGFSSPNFIQQLIAGRRNLTSAAAEKVAAKLCLKDPARQYLFLLVQLSRAKKPEELDKLMRSMKRLVVRAKRLSIRDSSIFDHWLYGIVFEMFKLDRFKSEADLLSAELRISVPAQQLRQSFEFLIQHKYLRAQAGKWITADVEFQPHNDVRKINSQQNHLKFLVLAQHRMNDELSDREFQGLTFAAKENRMPEMKDRIRTFIRAINDEFSEDFDGDQILRLQLSLFQILKPKR